MSGHVCAHILSVFCCLFMMNNCYIIMQKILFIVFLCASVCVWRNWNFIIQMCLFLFSNSICPSLFKISARTKMCFAASWNPFEKIFCFETRVFLLFLVHFSFYFFPFLKLIFILFIVRARATWVEIYGDEVANTLVVVTRKKFKNEMFVFDFGNKRKRDNQAITKSSVAPQHWNFIWLRRKANEQLCCTYWLANWFPVSIDKAPAPPPKPYPFGPYLRPWQFLQYNSFSCSVQFVESNILLHIPIIWQINEIEINQFSYYWFDYFLNICC